MAAELIQLDDPDITVAIRRSKQARRLTLTGSTLRPRSDAFKSALCDEIAQTSWPLFATRELQPVMDEVFPLKDASAAHARMEAGEHIGKIVLKVAHD